MGGRDKARARDGETCKAASVLGLGLEMTGDNFLSTVLGIFASARVSLNRRSRMWNARRIGHRLVPMSSDLSKVYRLIT